MNNLAYASRDKESVAPKVEDLLRKELAAPAPIMYTVQEEGSAEISAGTILKDMSTTFFGGKDTPLMTIIFQIAQPRAAGLEVHMSRQGVGCVAGPLVYSAVLNKPCCSGVSLGDDGKFSGDSAMAAKLNGRKDVLKKCSAFAVTKGGLAGSEMKIPRTFKVLPHEQGSQIVAVTLPASKSMGFSATLNSKEFLALIPDVEGAL